MDCQACQRLLQAYLDGDLDGAPFAEVERHVDRCPDCRAELDRLIKMRELLRDLREVDVPPGEREAFIDALRQRIEAERARGYPRAINWRPALVTCIAVVIALIVIVGVPHRAPSPTISPAPGLNKLENVRIDMLIMSAMDDHFLATEGDFLSDPGMTGGQALLGWKVVKDTHGDLFEPAD